jgi:hypothetical protein
MIKDALRQHLEPILADQVDHPVYPAARVMWDEPYDTASLAVAIGPRVLRWTPDQLFAFMDDRRDVIEDENRDPYRHGYEPAIWRESDWRLAELRVANPGDPIIFAVLGGNGSGKSYYGASRFDMAMVENEDWLCWQHSLDEDSSREVPQRIIYSYLPEEYRTDKGKLKKTAQTKLSYNKVNGFTDNTFGLENSSRTVFKFYGGGDVNALEGPRPDFVWADEMVPPDWVEVSCKRLVTKAGKTWAIIPALRKAVEARQAIIAQFGHVPELMQEKLKVLWKEQLRPILPKLLQGVCLVTFTPKNGYTQTVAMLTSKARTLEEMEAELLPITREGRIVGYEKVPRVLWNDSVEFATCVMFFHIYDNPFGGNWDSQKKRLMKVSRADKLWQAYGVATKIAGAALPKFGNSAHVRPLAMLPKEGTWYHVVDPCTDGRNWFMIWAKVCPNPIGKPLIWVAREWPMQGDWIVAGNVGNPGAWAELKSSGKADGRKKSSALKADGERGPAQTSWGLGFREMADEIERAERALYTLDTGLEGGRIEVEPGCRFMDSHAANTESQSHSACESLITTMAEYGLHFIPSGRDSGASVGSTNIGEGVQMINDRLFYDDEQSELMPSGYYKFHGRAPSIVIAETCQNLIFAASVWTGQDGGKGATKDPIDTLRYLVISNPVHIPPRIDGSNQSFGY